MSLIRLFASSWLLLLTLPLWAQDPNLEFGQVAEDWLTQHTYAPYPTASAVYLLDRGEIEIFPDGDKMRTVYTLHQRTKILNDAGLAFANQSIRFQHKDRREEVSDIQGVTIWQDESGKTHRAKLEKSDIFEEVLDDTYTLIKFALPQARVGAVVEFSYQKERQNSYYLPTWYFQGMIPALYSSYTTRVPNWYFFGVAMIGEELEVGEEAFRAQTAMTWESEHSFRDKRAAIAYNGTATTYAMRDLAPLMEEPYMTHLRDYAAQVSFQLKVIQRQDKKFETVQATWPEVIDELLTEWESWQAYEKSQRFYKKWLEEEELTGSPEMELAKAIYRRVQTRLRWNQKYSFHDLTAPKKVLDEGEGNSGEINLLLTYLLKQAGFTAHPALLSTREYGKVNREFPSLTPFNQIIAVVYLDQTWHLLDATQDDYPFNRLPESNLNHTALLVDLESPSWLNVLALHYDMERVNFSGQIDAEGGIQGSIQAQFLGYAAHRARRGFLDVDENPQDFWATIGLNETLSLQIEDPAVTPNQQDDPFTAQLTFEAPQFASLGNEFLYFQPAAFFELQENPFRLEKRNFPVDYSTPKKWANVSVFVLPPGYEIESLPENCEWELGEGDLYFLYQLDQSGPMLQLNCLLEIRNTFFEPESYAELRQFYDRVVAKVQEQIVLVKREEP